MLGARRDPVEASEIRELAQLRSKPSFRPEALLRSLGARFLRNKQAILLRNTADL